jgi:uncharacterized protein YjgD (DUF1641 family)
MATQTGIGKQLPREGLPQDAFSSEQIEGLAFLGELAFGIKHALEGTLGETATTAIVRTGGWFGRYDLPELLEESLDTLSTLRDSGVLAMLRDNTGITAETLRMVVPLVMDWLAGMQAGGVVSLQADLKATRAALHKLRLLGEFIDENFGDDLAVQFVKLANSAQDTGLADTLSELLSTLKHLSANGTLQRLRTASDLQSALLDGIDSRALMDTLVETLGDAPVGKLHALLKGVDAAMLDARSNADTLGGYRGLLRLLQDREVQVGFRALTVLPASIERIARVAGDGAVDE